MDRVASLKLSKLNQTTLHDCFKIFNRSLCNIFIIAIILIFKNAGKKVSLRDKDISRFPKVSFIRRLHCKCGMHLGVNLRKAQNADIHEYERESIWI